MLKLFQTAVEDALKSFNIPGNRMDKVFALQELRLQKSDKIHIVPKLSLPNVPFNTMTVCQVINRGSFIFNLLPHTNLSELFIFKHL